jgi:hypothetical protein
VHTLAFNLTNELKKFNLTYLNVKSGSNNPNKKGPRLLDMSFHIKLPENQTCRPVAACSSSLHLSSNTVGAKQQHISMQPNKQKQKEAEPSRATRGKRDDPLLQSPHLVRSSPSVTSAALSELYPKPYPPLPLPAQTSQPTLS